MSHRMRHKKQEKPSMDSQESKTSSDSKESIKKQLLNNNFDRNKKYFIMLHVSWCPHCTDALPSFMEAKEILNKEKGMCVEEFECERHPELKKLTSGFPTFLEIVNNYLFGVGNLKILGL